MIYFMRPADRELIKIGYTKDVLRRKRQLSKHWGCPYRLVKVIPGGRKTEREIHELLSHLRVGKTEFFRSDDSLTEFLIDSTNGIDFLRFHKFVSNVQNYLNCVTERYGWEMGSWQAKAMGEVLKRFSQQTVPDPKRESPSNGATQEQPMAAGEG